MLLFRAYFCVAVAVVVAMDVFVANERDDDDDAATDDDEFDIVLDSKYFDGYLLLLLLDWE